MEIPESIAGRSVSVAARRATESLAHAEPLFRDPLAEFLVSLAPQVPADQRDYLADGVTTTSSMTRIMGEYMSVRTHFFDTHLLATARAGARQIVLLGAGLDARAFRLPWPAGTRVFEVDTADNHAFKDDLLARAGLTATAGRTAVAADVTGDWREMIAAAGFDSTAPSSFLLEGPLFYLDRATSDGIAADLAAYASPGVWLAGDYPTSTPQERAAFAARLREPGDDDADGGESIADSLVPRVAPGPGVPPAQWLPPAHWEVTQTTFAEHAAAIDRYVPDHWNPGRGGEPLWLFHARVHRA